jgi:hypothetical protein
MPQVSIRRARVLTAVSLAAALALLTAGGALAAGPHGQTVTVTDHAHGVFDDPQATNPCNGDAFTAPDGGAGVQVTGNLVSHVTFFTNSGEFWATFTETGKIVGTDVGTGATYTGHGTVWGNFNQNKQNANTAFTLTMRLTGDDGSFITAHQTTVMVINANGTITASFDKLNLTCG